MSKSRKVKIINSEIPGGLTYLYKCWEYRHLIVSLAQRDLKAKFSQTILGVAWSVLKPLTGLAIFTFFFSTLIKIDTNNIPYPIFAFTGITAWYFFTYIVSAGGMSMVESQDLLKKVYFPKLILPLSKVIVGLLDFILSFFLLILLMIILGYGVHWQIIFLPILIALNAIAGISIAIWLSALTIRYRDFHHIIPYLVNFGIWLTPVFYPTTLIPESYNWALYINPMAGIITGYRWALTGDAFPSIYYIYSIIIIILLLISGFKYFKKIEREIADII